MSPLFLMKYHAHYFSDETFFINNYFLRYIEDKDAIYKSINWN